MTHIVIHPNQTSRNEYLLKLVSQLFEKEINDFEQLRKNPDIHLVSTEGSIGIEEVKDLQKEMIFQPFQERVQIAIIDNSQLLTHEAQNALLKTLEEPSDTTEYILLVDNQKNLLDTILSRGKRHYVASGIKDSEESKPPEILGMDLVERFAFVEKVVKDGDTEEFLNSLLNYFRVKLREKADGDVSEIQEQISAILTAQKRLKANGNKRLVLENLALRLQ